MDQEMKVLEILKGLAGFGIGEDGKLILRTNDWADDRRNTCCVHIDFYRELPIARSDVTPLRNCR